MRRRARAGLGAALCMVLAAGPALAQQRIGTEEFLARIERARATAAGGASAPSPEKMSLVREALGLPAEIDTTWGVLALPADPVLADLEGRGARDFEAARLRLGALESAARAAFEAEPPDRGRLEGALRSAYAGVRSRPNLVERMRLAFLGFVGSLLERIGDLSGLGGFLAVVVIAALVVVLIAIARRLGVVPDRRVERGRAGSAAEVVDWRRLADEARARGDLNEAVRLRFRALVEELGARGVVRPTPSITAGECRVAVRSELPRASAAVEEATAIFERAAYAHATVGDADLEAVVRAEREVARR